MFTTALFFCRWVCFFLDFPAQSLCLLSRISLFICLFAHFSEYLFVGLVLCCHVIVCLFLQLSGFSSIGVSCSCFFMYWSVAFFLFLLPCLFQYRYLFSSSYPCLLFDLYFFSCISLVPYPSVSLSASLGFLVALLLAGPFLPRLHAGFEDYGMKNPISSLGFIHLRMRFCWQRAPLLAALSSVCLPPSSLWLIPSSPEPHYLQTFGSRCRQWRSQEPRWVPKFFQLAGLNAPSPLLLTL